MILSGCNANQNNLCFNALDQSLCYLHHHPYIPVMLPRITTMQKYRDMEIQNYMKINIMTKQHFSTDPSRNTYRIQNKPILLNTPPQLNHSFNKMTTQIRQSFTEDQNTSKTTQSQRYINITPSTAFLNDSAANSNDIKRIATCAQAALVNIQKGITLNTYNPRLGQ